MSYEAEEADAANNHGQNDWEAEIDTAERATAHPIESACVVYYGTLQATPLPKDCPADVGSCWCCLDAGHDGPHECGGLDCNGAWNGDDYASFEVVRWPI